MSDVLFLESLAVYSGYKPAEINAMTKDELFTSLKDKISRGEINFKSSNIKPEWITAYFSRDSVSEPITTLFDAINNSKLIEVAKAFGYDQTKIDSMSKEKLFECLQNDYLNEKLDLSILNEENSWMETFIEKNSLYEPIMGIGENFSGDKTVHEMCKALVECKNQKFYDDWVKYCEDKSSTTYREYSALADTYMAELRAYLKEGGIVESQIDDILKNRFDNIDHIIFRALQRDGVASVEVKSWQNGAMEDDISTFMKEISDIIIDLETASKQKTGTTVEKQPTSQKIGELTLLYDTDKQKFGTLEYAIDDWDKKAIYYPHR